MSLLHANRTLNTTLERWAASQRILLTRPVLDMTTSSLNIRLGYIPVNSSSQSSLSINMVNLLSDHLSKVYDRRVVLNLIRMNNHYTDANILVRYISLLIGRSMAQSHKFRPTVRALLKNVKYSPVSSSPDAGEIGRASDAYDGIEAHGVGSIDDRAYETAADCAIVYSGDIIAERERVDRPGEFGYIDECQGECNDQAVDGVGNIAQRTGEQTKVICCHGQCGDHLGCYCGGKADQFTSIGLPRMMQHEVYKHSMTY